MPVKVKLKITREILLDTMFWSKDDRSEGCAIDEAIWPVLPNSLTFGDHIRVFTDASLCKELAIINLPDEAIDFIIDWDKASPVTRATMPEFSFEIEIPDEVVGTINISKLVNHPSLKIL